MLSTFIRYSCRPDLTLLVDEFIENTFHASDCPPDICKLCWRLTDLFAREASHSSFLVCFPGSWGHCSTEQCGLLVKERNMQRQIPFKKWACMLQRRAHRSEAIHSVSPNMMKYLFSVWTIGQDTKTGPQWRGINISGMSLKQWTQGTSLITFDHKSLEITHVRTYKITEKCLPLY